jgi:hypothetical protein
MMGPETSNWRMQRPCVQKQARWEHTGSAAIESLLNMFVSYI